MHRQIGRTESSTTNDNGVDIVQVFQVVQNNNSFLEGRTWDNAVIQIFHECSAITTIFIRQDNIQLTERNIHQFFCELTRSHGLMTETKLDDAIILIESTYI
ncbi:hypothetical protein D3C73_1424570 [compost metagenome]